MITPQEKPKNNLPEKLKSVSRREVPRRERLNEIRNKREKVKTITYPPDEIGEEEDPIFQKRVQQTESPESTPDKPLAKEIKPEEIEKEIVEAEVVGRPEPKVDRLTEPEPETTAVTEEVAKEEIKEETKKEIGEDFLAELKERRSAFLVAEEKKNKSAEIIRNLQQIKSGSETALQAKTKREQELQIDLENFQRLKSEYEKTLGQYAKILYEKKAKELATDADKEKKMAEYTKSEIYKEVYLNEDERINQAKQEKLPAKQKKWYHDCLYKFSKLPKYQRWLISAGVATGAAAAFTPTAIGAGALAGYFGIRAGRAALGTLSADLTDRVLGRKIKEGKAKMEKGLEVEFAEKIKDAKNVDNIMKIFTEQAATAREKLEAQRKKERRQHITKAIAMLGVAGGTSAGLGFLESYLVAHDILPSVKGTVEPAKPKAVPGQEKPVAPAMTEQDWRQGQAMEKAMEPGTGEWEKIHELASIKKGEGIENVLIRQLEDNPQGMGCPEEIIGNAKAVHQWAGEQAHEIAKEQGYFKVGADGKITETRVYWDAKKPTEFLLSHDTTTGKFSVAEIGNKTYAYENITPTDTEQEISQSQPPITEMQKEAPVVEPLKGQPEGSETLDLKKVESNLQEFYKEQHNFESTEIPASQKMAQLNESIASVDRELETMLNQVSDSDISSVERNTLLVKMHGYNDFKKSLEQAVAKGESESTLVKDVLPSKFMHLEHFNKFMKADKLADLTPNEKIMINRLFEKYLGHTFTTFKGFDPELQKAYLTNLARQAGKTIDVMVSQPELELPRLGFFKRSFSEMKWLEQIWKKFGKA